MTKVKICGITNPGDALLAVEYGVDELGFNFYENSPRYIEPGKAAAITSELPANIARVGVFVNESVDRILEIAGVAGLDAIQLHGDEQHDFVTRLHSSTEKEIIKAIRVAPDLDIGYLMDFDVHCILLDSFSKYEYGGSGQTFDWKIVEGVQAMIPYIYLAGGLSPENVGDAVRQLRPYAVDVCSGIESEPGKKDAGKMKLFIDAVRQMQ